MKDRRGVKGVLHEEMSHVGYPKHFDTLPRKYTVRHATVKKMNVVVQYFTLYAKVEHSILHYLFA